MRHPERYLDGPPAHHLEAWDELCAVARVVAIGGLDTHQHGFRVGGRMVTPMPNERYFGLLRTYALCDQPPSRDLAADSAAVLESLREGRCYLGIDGVAPARGFRYWGENSEDLVDMGSERAAGDWVLRALLPDAARSNAVARRARYRPRAGAYARAPSRRARRIPDRGQAREPRPTSALDLLKSDLSALTPLETPVTTLRLRS